MLFRPRVFDALAVLGVVILLLVAPAYMAQSPAERELSEGLDLHFSAPRIGDRASLDLVFQWDDEKPVVIEGARVVAVKAVTPGEIPVQARYVVEEQRLPLRAAFPWGDLMVDAWTGRTYYDADGRPVWHGQVHATANEASAAGATAGASLDGWSRVVTDGDSELNHFSGPPVVFHPSDVALIRREAAENLLNLFASTKDGASRGSEVHVEMSNQVFDVDGSLYLLLEHDPYEALIGRGDERAFDGTRDFTDGLTFDDFMADGGRFAGGRFGTEDWSMPIGGWQRYTDDDHRLDVWAVPRIERGSGDDLPVRHQWRFAYSGYSLPPATQPDLPQVALGDLPGLETEWQNGLTLPELVGLLRSDAAAPAVQDAARGRLAAFAWDAGPVTEPTEGSASGVPTLPLPAPPPGLPGENEPVPGAVARDDWVAAFLAEDGHVRVVNATIETTIEGHRLVRSVDLCDVQPAQQHGFRYVLCQFVPVPISDPARQIVDPSAALERIAQHDGSVDLPDRFVYQPLGHYELRSPAYRGSDAFSEWQSPFEFDGQSPRHFVSHDPDERLPTGIVHWATRTDAGADKAGQLWGDTGQFVMIKESTPQPEGEGLGAVTEPTTATAFAGAVPVPLEVRSGEALTGSLLLLGLWGLVRAVLGVKSGAWAPAFAALYAKIAREDVLDHERRDAIVSLLNADPGLTTTEIGERLNMGWGATIHHLETLQRNGLLAMVRHGHRRHYFRAAGMSKEDRLKLVYSRDPIYGPFLRTVNENPGAPLKDLIEQLRQGKAGASRTGKRLVELGLVRREKAGREVRFYPAT